MIDQRIKDSILAAALLICIVILFRSGHAQEPTGSDNSSSVASPQRVIEFAGVRWHVKTGGPMGPGPNYWSDGEYSVWLDEQKRLHMTIRKVAGLWYCSEIYTEKFTTYGQHRFLVDGYIDRMDKNIVLGLFLYANDQAEIDIEYSKWGNSAYTTVGGYTVQPYSHQGNNLQFESPLNSSQSTQFFDWQPAYVMFGSIQGHYYGAPPSQKDYIKQWIYSGADNPASSDNLRTHINFWLMNGQPPVDLLMLEVIITDVVQPLSTSALHEKKAITPPEELRLDQNYPNPFNSRTAIHYYLPEKSHVRLSLYNSAGQRVDSLISEIQTAGQHEILWEANAFASGVYICRLETDKGSESMKILLVR